MFDSLAVNIEPSREKLVQLFEDAKALDLTPLDETLLQNELRREYEAQRRIVQ